MNMIDVQYIANKTMDLCRIPSPTGFTEEAIAYTEKEFARLGVETRRTRKGALIATLPGQNAGAERAIAAHVDTLGAMVKEIKGNGRLKLTKVGGYSGNAIEGEYCLVHKADGGTVSGTILVTKASTHVHGAEHAKQERSEETLEVRLDAKVRSKDDVLALGIQVGDFISFDPRTTMTDTGFIKTRHLDDKACVAILFAVARAVKEQKLQLAHTTHFFISNYEETGHGAAGVFPEAVTEVIALDMAAVGDGQTSDEYSVTICVKDSSGPYDYELSRRLQRIAAEEEIDFRIDIYPYYGSDASAALRAGGQFKAALVGPGIDASHSYERVHLDALEQTTRLLLAYLTR
ncbi:MAG: M42 family metallopeptidase [Bacillota bacterium]